MMKKHIKRILSYEVILLPAVVLVCVGLSVRIKFDEWRKRRQRVRKSEGVREEVEDNGYISVHSHQHACGSCRRARDCRDSQTLNL